MKKIIKRVFLVLFLALAAFVAFLLIRAVTAKSLQMTDDEFANMIQMNADVPMDAVQQHFSEALQFQTDSYYEDDEAEAAYREELGKLQAFLRETYPLVFSSLTVEVVNDYSLLMTWQGSDDSLKPVLLTGHMDVGSPGPEDEWKQPPYSGKIVDGYIWGRGAADDKLSVIGILEAMDYLLKMGYQPKSTIQIALGHDEEIGGEEGAIQIADLLRRRGMKYRYQVDEGSIIYSSDVLNLTDKPLALVMTAEKGTVNLELSVGGKDSPLGPRTSAAKTLCAAVDAINGASGKKRLCEAEKHFYQYLAAETSFPNNLAMSNLWLFESVLANALPPEESQTLYSVATVEGTREAASAMVRVRILPGETIETVIAQLTELVADERVRISVVGPAYNPSGTADPTAQGYKNIEASLRTAYTDIVVVPAILIAATDARHYADLVENTYRFTPIYETPEDVAMIHGLNERISLDCLEKGIKFYINLIANAAEGN